MLQEHVLQKCLGNNTSGTYSAQLTCMASTHLANMKRQDHCERSSGEHTTDLRQEHVQIFCYFSIETPCALCSGVWLHQTSDESGAIIFSAMQIDLILN